jgi:hypothetical protein
MSTHLRIVHSCWCRRGDIACYTVMLWFRPDCRCLTVCHAYSCLTFHPRRSNHSFRFNFGRNRRPYYLYEVIIPKGYSLLWKDLTTENGDYLRPVLPVVRCAVTPLPKVLQFYVYFKEEGVNDVGFLFSKEYVQGSRHLCLFHPEKKTVAFGI